MNLRKFQTIANLPVTGKYDEITTAAINNFQLGVGLPVTGKIDVATKRFMLSHDESLQDTDGSGVEEPSISFKFTTTFKPKSDVLKKGEYYIGPTKKTAIFLHHTAGWHDPYNVIAGWEKDTRGAVGTAFVIGGRNPVTNESKVNGEVVQCFPLTGYAWHLGLGNTTLHRNSIGIELCNFGQLTKKSDGFYTYTNRRIDDSNVLDLKKEFRGFRYYQKYSDEQVKALRETIIHIGKETGIDVTLGLQKQIKKNAWNAFEFNPLIKSSGADGLYTHANVVRSGKWDLFPQQEVIDMILTL